MTYEALTLGRGEAFKDVFRGAAVPSLEGLPADDLVAASRRFAREVGRKGRLVRSFEPCSHILACAKWHRGLLGCRVRRADRSGCTNWDAAIGNCVSGILGHSQRHLGG